MDEVIPKFFDGERRLTILLVGYWQEAREGRRCPLVSDFTALVPAELLSDCFTYEPGDAGEGGWIRDIGAALARASGIVAKDMALSDAPPNSLLGVVGQFLGQALQGGTLVLEEGAFEDARGVKQLYRATLLPLENEAGGIALVIGGARCKPA